MHGALRRVGPFVAIVTLPGGIAFGLWLAVGVRTACQDPQGRPIATGDAGCPAALAYLVTHPTGSWSFDHVFGPTVLMLALTLSVLSALYLAVRIRRAFTESRSRRRFNGFTPRAQP